VVASCILAKIFSCQNLKLSNRNENIVGRFKMMMISVILLSQLLPCVPEIVAFINNKIKQQFFFSSLASSEPLALRIHQKI
jgi:hypothetical protein